MKVLAATLQEPALSVTPNMDDGGGVVTAPAPPVHGANGSRPSPRRAKQHRVDMGARVSGTHAPPSYRNRGEGGQDSHNELSPPGPSRMKVRPAEIIQSARTEADAVSYNGAPPPSTRTPTQDQDVRAGLYNFQAGRVFKLPPMLRQQQHSRSTIGKKKPIVQSHSPSARMAAQVEIVSPTSPGKRPQRSTLEPSPRARAAFDRHTQRLTQTSTVRVLLQDTYQDPTLAKSAALIAGDEVDNASSKQGDVPGEGDGTIESGDPVRPATTDDGVPATVQEDTDSAAFPYGFDIDIGQLCERPSSAFSYIS